MAQGGKKKETGIIIAGEDPVAVDCVCAKIMRFDYLKIKLLSRAFEKNGLALTDIDYEDIYCKSNNNVWDKKLSEISNETTFHFDPHFGWKGHIEL